MSCFLVLHLPSSGSSLVTGIAHYLGLDMGSDLTASANEWNPLGFFEDPEAAWLNTELLGPNVVPNPELYGKYKEYLDRRARRSSCWGYKHGLTQYLVPLILESMDPATVHAIVPRRPFHESCLSWAKRIGRPIEQVTNILAGHLFALEEALDLLDDRILQVPYHDLLRSDSRESTLAKIADFVHLPVNDTARAFIHPEFRHFGAGRS